MRRGFVIWIYLAHTKDKNNWLLTAAIVLVAISP